MPRAIKGNAARKRLLANERSGGKGDTEEMPVEALPKPTPKQKRAGKSASFDIQLEGHEGLFPNVGAGALCAAIADALLEFHRDSIMAGETAEGGSQQDLHPRGQQGQLAKSGKRPKARAWTGKAKGLPLELTRSEIRATGRPVKIDRKTGRIGLTAHCNISAGNPLHDDFLHREHDEKGIEYLYVTGEAERLIDATLHAYLETFDNEKGRRYQSGKIKARDL